jgi:hypothetical protein
MNPAVSTFGVTRVQPPSRRWSAAMRTALPLLATSSRSRQF